MALSKKLLSTFILLTGIVLSEKSTAQTYTPTDDAMVYAASVNNNYGTDTKLQVKKKEGSAITRYAFLKFDVMGLTATQVGKARLRLYCNNKAVDTIQSVIGAFATANNWTEATLKWSNAPVLGALQKSIVAVAKQNYYEWDITSYLRQMVASGSIISLAITDLNQSNNLVEFSSKEAVNKPQLIVSTDIEPTNAAYYLDAIDGDDNNTGTTAATAWKTLGKINTTNLSEGASIYLKSGQYFRGLLNLSSAGTASAPVVYSTYGGTEPATINGQGQPAAVFAYNRSYIELRNLMVKNYRPDTFALTELFSGITFINENGGTLSHVYLDSIKVDSVNASSDVNDDQTVYNGGVRFRTLGLFTPSKFDDVLIQNCTFQNLSRTGCNFDSDWELRNVNTNFGDALGDGRTDNWVPNTKVVIRDNTFRKIAGNGLIVRVANKALIEGNFFDSCGTDISGNAVFNFNTDSTVYQFNEAQNTVYNTGDTDARGIDADFRTENTVIQYNYLHNNGLGGVVATGGDQTTGQIPQRYNVGTVIRYNLIENNDRQGIAFSGAINGLDVYNNTIYADSSHSNVIIVRSAIWAVAPKNLRFKNNVFYYNGTGLSYSFASGSTYNFQNNLFYGNRPTTEPADAAKITGDPMFTSTQTGANNYKYLVGSAALGSGMMIASNGSRDYYGEPVSATANPNVGMYNGAPITILPLTVKDFFATRQGQAVQLQWTALQTGNTALYEVQRSADGSIFETIGRVRVTNNANGYSFTDATPLKGRNYYRLQQLDKNGKQQFSPIRIVNMERTELLTMYPNPAHDQVSISGGAIGNSPLVLTIFDIQGKKIKLLNQPASPAIDISVADLNRGIYTLQVQEANSGMVIGTIRFLKQ